MKPNLIKILPTFYCILFCMILNAQTNKSTPLDLPYGKCQAKCLMADLYDMFEIAVPAYIGEDDNIIKKFVRDTIIFTRESSTKWVKKKKDRTCLSKDPKDCLVWCLVEVPAEKIQIDWFLTDTTVTTDYIIEYYMSEELIEKRGFREWQEVVCEKDINSYLMNEVRMALGMLNPNNNALLDEETSKELRNYQTNNGLPIGGLNLQTLEHLGIEGW